VDRQGRHVRGILTLASGPEHFHRWARYLLVSIRRLDPTCAVAVVTDQVDSRHLQGFDEVIPLDPSKGLPYQQKLWLDDYSPFAETLFLDADCLLYCDLEQVWASVRSATTIGVAAREVAAPYWCADVSNLPAEYQVATYLEYNGGLVYWRASTRTGELFAEARDIFEHHYDAFGLRRFGAYPGDEPALALTLSRHGIRGIVESRHTMRSLAGLVGEPELQIAHGRARFAVYEGQVVEPAIVHFTGLRARELHARELLALRLRARGVPAGLAQALAPAARRARSAVPRQLG
jgi:hypothetical protein